MEKLKIKKETADKIISFIQTKLKEFTEDESKPKNIIERIQTLQDVIEVTDPGAEVINILNYAGPNRKLIGAKNFILAELIAEAYNEGWEADYKNNNQKKWYGWFDGSRGFAFVFSRYDGWDTNAGVGSRLCFETEAKLLDAVKKFPNVYKELLTK